MRSIRSNFLLPAFCMFGMFLIVFIWFERDKYVIVANNVQGGEQTGTIRKVLKERNEISLLLNNEKKKSGQLECNIGTVAGSGGWCKQDSSVNSTEHMTDTKLAKQLSIFFKGKRVASFGDGPGLYKKYFDSTNLLEVYDAYDGAPFAENTTEGRVKFLDLSVPQYGLPVYDWIMSLEVAEHIPAKYEKIFMSNLVRHAIKGIILSWAVPGQGGHFHVNNRPLSFVVSSLKELGFERNLDQSLLLQSQCELPWLHDNTNVYIRRDDHPIDVDNA